MHYTCCSTHYYSVLLPLQVEGDAHPHTTSPTGQV